MAYGFTVYEPHYFLFQVVYLLKMTERIRTLNIAPKLIKRASTDPDFGLALILVIFIKAHSVSSVIKQYNIRDFKNRYHVGADKVRKAIAIGIKEKLLQVFSIADKKHKTIKYLKALPIHENGHCYRFQVCNSPSGIQIYLDSKTKNNYSKYSQRTSPTSFNDVDDLFMIITLDKLNKGYWKGRDQELRQKLESTGSSNLIKKCHTFEQMRNLEQEIFSGSKVDNYNWINTGYSFRRMAEKCGRRMTVYKITQLMHKAIEDGLFCVQKNQICVREGNSLHRHWNDDLGIKKPDMCSSNWGKQVFDYVAKQEQAIKSNQRYFNDHVYHNPYTGEYEDLDTRGYWGKKTTPHATKHRYHKMIKDVNGKWTKVKDANSPDGFAWTEKWEISFTHENRYKRFKRMANSYIRCNDFEGMVYDKEHYGQTKKAI